MLTWGRHDSLANSMLANEQVVHEITFHRLSQVLKVAPLYGQKGIRPDDINQGSIGSCWFLAAAAAISASKGAME